MSDEQITLPDPRDGYIVLRHEESSEIQLGLRIRAGGKVLHEAVFWRFADSLEGRGRASRLEHLLEAVCLFQNAGGERSQLYDMLAVFDEMVGKYRIAWPENWIFLGYSALVPERPQLVFSDQMQSCIVFEPGVFIDSYPETELLQRLRRG